MSTPSGADGWEPLERSQQARPLFGCGGRGSILGDVEGGRCGRRGASQAQEGRERGQQLRRLQVGGLGRQESSRPGLERLSLCVPLGR